VRRATGSRVGRLVEAQVGLVLERFLGVAVERIVGPLETAAVGVVVGRFLGAEVRPLAVGTVTKEGVAVGLAAGAVILSHAMSALQEYVDLTANSFIFTGAEYIQFRLLRL
jgi:hypothetical protein